MSLDRIRVAVVGAEAEGQWWERQADVAREAGVTRAGSQPASGARAPDWWYDTVQHPAVDAVCVCGTSAERAELIIAALQAGKHVLAGPPVAADWENVLRMTEIALDRGVVLQTALPDRHRPAVASLRTWITARATGDLMVLLCRAGRLAAQGRGAPPTDSLESLLARVIGVTSWLMGGFADVIGLDSPSGQTASAILSHAAGALAWVQVSLVDDTVAFEVEAAGRDGYATAHSGGEGLERAALGPRDLTGPFRETVVQSVRDDSCGAREWEAFAAAIRSEGARRSAAEETLALTRLFLATRRSARTGGVEAAY